MLASITHLLPLTTVIRKRLLPCNGRVLARVGQKVDPSVVVAEAIVGRQHTIIDIARSLNVSPRKAAALIKVKRGQKVKHDETIAETSGMFSSEVKAPADGRIVAIGGGKLVLETGGTTLELFAGVSGVVTEIITNRGVAIRATGCVIQGLWGNGKIDTAVMMSIMDRPDEAFDATRLDVSIRSSIILGGHIDNSSIFKTASDLPVRGLIISSMSPALIPVAMQQPYPILLIDGFIRQPMDSSSYKLLSTNVRREITLNATTHDRFTGERPEIFITLPVSQDPPEIRDLDVFTTGQTVRIVSLTRPARIGTIVQLQTTLNNLPNNLKVKSAEVKLEHGERILVPLTNLEVLG